MFLSKRGGPLKLERKSMHFCSGWGSLCLPEASIQNQHQIKAVVQTPAWTELKHVNCGAGHVQWRSQAPQIATGVYTGIHWAGTARLWLGPTNRQPDASALLRRSKPVFFRTWTVLILGAPNRFKPVILHIFGDSFGTESDPTHLAQVVTYSRWIQGFAVCS